MSAPYPATPGHKGTDTAAAAAESMKGKAAGLRAKVMVALGYGPATADECASRLGLNILSIRPRLTELRELGKVEDTGTRRPNLSGRNAIVWKVAA